MSMYDDVEYEDSGCYVINTRKDDKYWKDAKGKTHYIKHMDIAHTEAVTRYLHKHGLVIPTALFERYKERHKEVINEFDTI